MRDSNRASYDSTQIQYTHYASPFYSPFIITGVFLEAFFCRGSIAVRRDTRLAGLRRPPTARTFTIIKRWQNRGVIHYQSRYSTTNDEGAAVSHHIYHRDDDFLENVRRRTYSRTEERVTSPPGNIVHLDMDGRYFTAFAEKFLSRQATRSFAEVRNKEIPRSLNQTAFLLTIIITGHAKQKRGKSSIRVSSIAKFPLQ